MIRTRRRSARRIRRPILESLEARQLLATFTVMSTADDGGSGTLRYAIGEANAASTPSTIDFKLGTSPATITLTQGQLEVDNYFYGITIDGPGASMLTISGNDASRVFEVGFGTDASISGLTITGGSTTGQNNYGAGLLNYAGNTTLTGCTISGNSSSTSGGGVMTESGSHDDHRLHHHGELIRHVRRRPAQFRLGDDHRQHLLGEHIRRVRRRHRQFRLGDDHRQHLLGKFGRLHRGRPGLRLQYDHDDVRLHRLGELGRRRRRRRR